MANHESLSDKAISTVGAVVALEGMLRQVNDYGDATGYCAEADQITNDLSALLGMVRARAAALRRRFALAQAEAKKSPGVAPESETPAGQAGASINAGPSKGPSRYE